MIAAIPIKHADARAHTVSSVCCYCGTGCGVRVQASGDQVLSVTGDPDHPSNQGRLCSKGRTLADTVRRDAARVREAEWRPRRDAARAPLALDDALELAAERLAGTIRRHGPHAVGFYLSGQLLTEDYAVFNKLARALVGTNNIDTNSRLCMSSAVSGYKRTLGADAPPACYDDLDSADLVLIAGSNMAYAHPVLFRRLEAAKAARPDMKVVVVDPRRTDTAGIADLHLAIAPGSDVALFLAMLNVMEREDLIDRGYIARHTQGFDALRARIGAYPPQVAQALCGVPASDIEQAARWFGQAGAALSMYTMGLNQSANGTAKNAALIHLHLATGQIGRPGAGPFSLTGQPNAMGGREAGGMATILPGHRDPADAAHRAEVAAAWGVPALPDTPGLPALHMFDAVLEGRVKVLWIAATNPAQSLPDQARVRQALRAAEFVIVQEAFANTETLAYADLVLPAATWPEKNGSVTNSERRISRVRAAIAPPGSAQPDWRLACGVARRLAARIAPHKAALFDYADEAAVFAEHAGLTAGRDLDYSAVDYAALEQGPRQWPVRGGHDTARLYADGRFPTPDGRARFIDVDHVPVADPVDGDFPLWLTTGRLRDHWHTMARTGLSATLVRHVEEPWISLHPQEMAGLGLAEDALVRVRSRRGAVVLPARADEGLEPGRAFLPMHWGSGFMAGDGVNALTPPACDPVSHQPELKHSAVDVAAAPLPWQAMAWLRGDAAALRQALAPWLARFPYAVLLPSALGGGGLRLRLAAEAAPAADVLDALARALRLDRPAAAFDDPARGVLRRAGLDDARRPDAFLLAGDTRAQAGMLAWADGGEAPAGLARLLMGRGGAAKRARTVCACMGVTDAAIESGIAAGLDLAGLKTQLGCGTGCGSCVPEIRDMLRRRRPVLAQASGLAT
ncbi:nitrate reductase%2C catalytic subunit [Bordetella ansorpii]|uniref:Nitrate reductase, catalytic subunit n=1 Tax=Bordetella ansorpii TaxID=288768 RepID=A0A157S5M0_9BORD|nr:nitrate reductase [Bordetella ansorpii]SAI65697.1 nitrate reductase%2C catalytic subunit [Bordetella ansorpii]